MLRKIWHTDARKIKHKWSRAISIDSDTLLLSDNGCCHIKDLLEQYNQLVCFYGMHRPRTEKEKKERRKETMQRYYARHRDEIRARQQSYYQERKKASTVKK